MRLCKDCKHLNAPSLFEGGAGLCNNPKQGVEPVWGELRKLKAAEQRLAGCGQDAVWWEGLTQEEIDARALKEQLDRQATQRYLDALANAGLPQPIERRPWWKL